MAAICFIKLEETIIGILYTPIVTKRSWAVGVYRSAIPLDVSLGESIRIAKPHKTRRASNYFQEWQDRQVSIQAPGKTLFIIIVYIKCTPVSRVTQGNIIRTR